MSFDPTRLYELLPALYRLRDAEIAAKKGMAKGPLESLLTVIGEEIAVLEENLNQLYDDQFIETCAEWVVPYIGDLVGARNLLPIPESDFSQRSEVANTIKYRRRKGTASVIEQLARDVTGWDANVVEFFQVLATTQYMNHIRPEGIATAGLKELRSTAYANTPFDRMSRTADVRSIAAKRGKYNIPNVGIFLWRVRHQALTQVPAFRVDERRYTFDPLGRDQQLYTRSVPEKDITQLAGPEHVALPIGRQLLHMQFEQLYGPGKSLLIAFDGENWLPKLTEGATASPGNLLEYAVDIRRLEDQYDADGNTIGWSNMPDSTVRIDPVRGRIALPAALAASALPGQIMVTYHYGFTAEIGGGEYGRAVTFSTGLPRLIQVEFENGSLQDALDEISTTGGVIEINDNATYREPLKIVLDEGNTIEIRAAEGKRPTLLLETDVTIEADNNTGLIFNGLVIAGGAVRLEADNPLQSLTFRHCTLVPDGEIVLSVAASALQLELDKTISGPLRVTEEASVLINNSIIDAGSATAIAYSDLSEAGPGGKLSVRNSTLIGKLYTRLMELASNCIFIADGEPDPGWPALIATNRLQEGCVRFSYFPPGSLLPSPFRCQPADPARAESVRPTFTSLQYGEAGYCQLSSNCAAEIMQGSDDDAEMGAFHHLYQPQRLANLRTRLNEYLRFGLEAGIFYAS